MLLSNEYIVSIILFLISIGMISMTWISWKSVRLHNKHIVIDMIFYFITVKLLFYYLLPTILRFLSSYQFLKQDIIPIHELIYVYLIEFISWFFWLITFYFVVKSFYPRKEVTIDVFFQKNYNKNIFIIVIISIGFILTRLSGMLQFNSALLQLYQSLFFYVGLSLGPFLLAVSFRYYNKYITILGIIITLFMLVSISSRGALFYMLCFLTFLVFFVTKSKKAKIYLILSGVGVVMFFLLLSALPKFTLFMNENGQIEINTIIHKEKMQGRKSVDEIEWRFGAQTRAGTKFIEMYDRGDGAGINPIMHSFLGFLPRSLNPDKPHPSTLIADDIYSQGMYLIWREVHGYDSYSMVEFPTGNHFYWEFGFPGVILLSIASAFYVSLATRLFVSIGAISLPLTIAIFKPWGFVDPKIWISDAILQIYQIILPLLLLLLLIRIYEKVNLRSMFYTKGRK